MHALAFQNWKTRVKERLATADMESVKADALRFVENRAELDIWSNAYFLQLADRIKFV